MRRVALLLFVTSGCATGTEAPGFGSARVVPEEETEELETAAPVVHEVEEEDEDEDEDDRRRITAADLAARVIDDVECVKLIKKLQGRSDKVAFAVLCACIRQDKFRDLGLLFSEPWQTFYSALPKDRQALLAAHILATRGANFKTDLRLVRRRGLGLYALKEVWDSPKNLVKEFVIFRGAVAARKIDRNGLTHLLIDEIGRATVDWGRRTNYYSVVGGKLRLVDSTFTKVGNVDRRMRTGRVVETKVARPKTSLRDKEEFVFLARFKKLVETDKNEQAVVELIDLFKRGALLPEIQR